MVMLVAVVMTVVMMMSMLFEEKIHEFKVSSRQNLFDTSWRFRLTDFCSRSIGF